MRRIVPLLCLGFMIVPAGPAAGQDDAVVAAIEPLTVERMADLIGDRRVVLLGENGHGVSEFSAFKARLATYLHTHRGFSVVAFESGFHECGEADTAVGVKPVRRILFDCLIVQLHHQEIEPLLDHAARSRATARPLRIAGIDLQIQGRSSRTRPRLFRAALGRTAPALGDTIAVLDSILIEKSFQPNDSVWRFVRTHGRFLRAAYDSGAALTRGDTAWRFRTGSALMRRELHRVAALSYGLEPPSDVYATRDLWMAETVRHLLGADSTRRMVVWLHNDHARYGAWQAGPLRIRAAGSVLREWMGDDVFSVGLLMGSGGFVDNSRRPRTVPEPPAGTIEAVFARAGHPEGLLALGWNSAGVGAWADREHAYLRGDQVFRMRPGQEFDALVWFAKVSPATYPPRN